jgi:hypothetical protein
MKSQRRDGMLSFRPYVDIRQNQDGTAVSCTHRTHFTLKEIRLHSFLLEAEWTPGRLNAKRRVRSLENFQGPHRDPKT